MTRFSGEKNVVEFKMCTLIYSTTFVWNIPHSKKNSGICMYGHKWTNVFM